MLLDAGGVLMLPSHEPIVAALAAVGVAIDAASLDGAHYAGMHALDEAPPERFEWRPYLEAYVRVLGVGAARREAAHRPFGREEAPEAAVEGEPLLRRIREERRERVRVEELREDHRRRVQDGADFLELEESHAGRGDDARRRT